MTTTTTIIKSVALLPREVQIYTDPNIHKRRRLLRYMGVKPVLVVCVTAQGGRGIVAADAAIISKKIFGTYGDQEMMQLQSASCSYSHSQLS
jgi:hypothetical protein